MVTITEATYNITDNRLKFWPAERLPDAEYKQVKALNFQWWPGRKCFSAIWSPGAEDFIISNGATIREDDSPDDIEGRVERFQKYAARDERDAESAAQRAIDATTKRRAEAAEATTVKKVDEARYWQSRIAGAIGRAEYRDRPDVIARRIKGLEADLRKHTKELDIHVKYEAIWKMEKTVTVPGRALQIANIEPGYFSMRFTKDLYPESTYEGDVSIWSALDRGTIDAAQAQVIMTKHHGDAANYETRWIAHLNTRLEYERAYWQAVGGKEEIKERKPRRVAKKPDNDPFSIGVKVAHYFNKSKQIGEVLKVNAKTILVKQLNGYERKYDRRELVLIEA